MTGRWVSPVEHDRMHSIVSGGLLEMTGRWGPASSHDLTDASGHSWNLTGSDRTLGPASGHATVLRPVIT